MTGKQDENTTKLTTERLSLRCFNGQKLTLRDTISENKDEFGQPLISLHEYIKKFLSRYTGQDTMNQQL